MKSWKRLHQLAEAPMSEEGFWWRGVGWAGVGWNPLGRHRKELSRVLIIFCILIGIWVTQMYIFIKTPEVADFELRI